MTNLVAAYLRRSTTKQEMSLDGQRAEVKAYAEKRGYRIVREYVDDGISGATGSKRPEFQKMIADAQSGGGFEAVLAYDLSRFGRMDADETGHFRHLLRLAEVRVIFTNENDGGDDDTGEILRSFLTVQKRDFLKQLSRDVLRGQIQCFKAGWVPGRQAPFGYDRVLIDESGVARGRIKRGEQRDKPRSWHVGLAISDTPHEAETVRWIFHAYTSREVGLAALARELNLKELKSPYGGKWCLATLRALLRNPIYKGTICFGRRLKGQFNRFTNGEITKTDRRSPKIEHRSIAECLSREEPELQLVSKEVWQKANDLFAERGKRSRRAYNRTDSYPLSGLLTCRECGKPMFGCRRDKNLVYSCTTWHKMRECHSNSVRSNSILDVVRRVIQRTVMPEGRLDRVKENLAGFFLSLPESQNTGPQVAAELARARAEYERAVANLLRAAPVHLDALNKVLDQLRQNVVALEAKVQQARVNDPEAQTAMAVKNLKGLLADLPRVSGSRLKAVLRELIDRVELSFDWTQRGIRSIRTVMGGTLYMQVFNKGGTGGRS